MRVLPAPGGGRWVVVPADRIEGWLRRFADRPAPVRWTADPEQVRVETGDGAVAQCRVPFPPLVVDPATPGCGLVAHVLRPRRVGVVLVRRGGHAVGLFDGDRLATSKVGARHVQGRTAAGGWSQQRFARRRAGQADAALGAAADVVASVLVPVAGTLDAVVLGGDRRSVTAVLEDPRLAALVPLVVGPLLDVPDPRLRVLQETPRDFRAVWVRVVDPIRDSS